MRVRLYHAKNLDTMRIFHKDELFVTISFLLFIIFLDVNFFENLKFE
jgi:hypothetical protein